MLTSKYEKIKSRCGYINAAVWCSGSFIIVYINQVSQ